MQSFGLGSRAPRLASPGVTRAGSGNSTNGDKIMYLLVMWNWGGFASAICRATPRRRESADTDVTMSWVSIVGRFRLCAWSVPPRFEQDGLGSAHRGGLR
jgi:hypothetical protein